MVSVFLATSAWVFGVAFARPAGDPSRVTSEATRFAYSAPGVMGAALASAAVLGGFSFAAARIQSRRVLERLRLGPSRASAAGFGAAVLGVVGLNAAAGAFFDLSGGHGQGTMEIVTQVLHASSPARLLLAVATIGIAPGLAEEVFFRGFLQGTFAARWPRWPSILVAAACFGIMHLDVVQGCVAFLAGVFLGWSVERFEGIRPSIAAHTLNNSVVVVLASNGSGGHESRATEFAAMGFGLALVGASVLLIRSRFSTRRAPSSPEEGLHARQ